MPLSDNPTLHEHLLRVEKAVQSVKPLLGNHEYPDDYRTVVVIGVVAQMIEHHEAILVLVTQNMIGSAFALARPLFEGMYRGLWLNVPATDGEVEKFISKDKIDLTIAKIAERIDPAYQTGDFFSDLKKRGWKPLNGYAHTGMLQLGRRFTEHEVKPSYTDGQITEMTTVLTTCVLVLVSAFLAKQNHSEDAAAVDALVSTYGSGLIKQKESEVRKK